MNPKPYTSSRVIGNEKTRIEFDPRKGLAKDWKEGDEVSSKPYLLFLNGTCVNAFETASEARRRAGVPDAAKWTDWK